MPMTISIDDDLKRDFSAVCKELGLTPSAAISVFAKAVVRRGGIPFEIAMETSHERAVRTYHERLVAEIEEADREIDEGRYATLKDIEAMHAELSKEGLAS